MENAPDSVRKILQAFIQCVCEVGIERATYRLVARRSGVSLGLVQHYFPTKNKLLVRAMMEVVEQMREARPSTSEDATVYDFLENHFIAWLPLTENLRNEFPFMLEYWRFTLRDMELRAETPQWEELSSRALDAVESVLASGQAWSPLSREDLANVLTATMAGLALRIALFPDYFTDAKVHSLLRQTLEALVKVPDSRSEDHRLEEVGRAT